MIYIFYTQAQLIAVLTDVPIAFFQARIIQDSYF